jgi:TRAP-type C4-dicarboxylate transport system permease small subunit
MKKLIEFSLVSILIVILLTTLLQVAVRYFRLPFHFPWTEELARFLNVWLTFLGAAYIVNNHISVDILKGRITPKAMKYIGIFSNLIACFFFSFVLWGAFLLSTTQTHLFTPAMEINMSLFYISVLISALVFLVYNFKQVVDIKRKHGEEN